MDDCARAVWCCEFETAAVSVSKKLKIVHASYLKAEE